MSIAAVSKRSMRSVFPGSPNQFRGSFMQFVRGDIVLSMNISDIIVSGDDVLKVAEGDGCRSSQPVESRVGSGGCAFVSIEWASRMRVFL